MEIHLVYYLFIGIRWVFRKLDRALLGNPLRNDRLAQILAEPERLYDMAPVRIRPARRWFSFWALWFLFSFLSFVVVVFSVVSLPGWPKNDPKLKPEPALEALLLSGLSGGVLLSFIGSWLILGGVELRLYGAGAEFLSLGKKFWIPWEVLGDFRAEPQVDQADSALIILPVGREGVRKILKAAGKKVEVAGGEDQFPVYLGRGMGIRIHAGFEYDGVEVGRLLMALGLYLGGKQNTRENQALAPGWVIEFQATGGKG